MVIGGAIVSLVKRLRFVKSRRQDPIMASFFGNAMTATSFSGEMRLKLARTV
jgi:hypothetical protein